MAEERETGTRTEKPVRSQHREINRRNIEIEEVRE
jgi:hypothetical protein